MKTLLPTTFAVEALQQLSWTFLVGFERVLLNAVVELAIKTKELAAARSEVRGNHENIL